MNWYVGRYSQTCCYLGIFRRCPNNILSLESDLKQSERNFWSEPSYESSLSHLRKFRELQCLDCGRNSPGDREPCELAEKNLLLGARFFEYLIGSDGPLKWLSTKAPMRSARLQYERNIFFFCGNVQFLQQIVCCYLADIWFFLLLSKGQYINHWLWMRASHLWLLSLLQRWKSRRGLRPKCAKAPAVPRLLAASWSSAQRKFPGTSTKT